MSLVAEDRDGTVVGHVVATRGSVDSTPALGIASDVPEWAPHLQARALTAHRADVTGLFRYAPPFYEIG